MALEDRNPAEEPSADELLRRALIDADDSAAVALKVNGLPVSQAVRTPTPERVQAAVKRCLMGLIILDAVLATALAGKEGLALLLLLVPVLLLSRQRWLYAT